MWVIGHSRSLKMARFDKPCVTFYWSAVVTIALSRTIFELFDVEQQQQQQQYTRRAKAHLRWQPY